MTRNLSVLSLLPQTMQFVKTIWWPGMKKDVRDFVESCKASAVSTTLA